MDVDDIIQRDHERKRKKQKEKQELKFRDYLELVRKDPLIAQNAPSRLLEAVMAFGTEPIKEPEQRYAVGDKEIKKRYKLFSDVLFGLERPVSQIVNYWRMGASRSSTGKQVLLLVGPTASGKSTIANLAKKALERYEARPVFAIKGCPIREEPLHLLPRKVADEVEKVLGIIINTDLCPVCRHNLLTKFRDDDGVLHWEEVPVERFDFSIRAVRGIASYEPSDDKSSDITDLTGKENLGVTTDPDRGYDDPYAFTLNGEICKSNRGLFEGVELIKCDEQVLRVFISLAEEQRVKVYGSSFPHINIDTNIVGHTNLTEYRRFSSKQENEALHDRIYAVPVPYPLRVKDEVQVYKKLIEKESDFQRFGECHICPGSLELAAVFAVLTRYKESQNERVSLLTKMKLYNGEHVLADFEEEDTTPIDVRALIEEGQSAADISKREGMSGVSSRDILSAINSALAREGNGCLTPLTVLRSLRKMFDHRMGYSDEEIDHYRELLTASEGDSVLVEYKEYVVKMVSKAFLGAYEDLARELFRKYVAEAEFYRSQRRKFLANQMEEIERDARTGKPKEPDIRLLRSVEQFVPVDESDADVWRGEILEAKASYKNPKDFNYDSYRPLAQAVEKKLLDQSRETLTLVLSEDEIRDEEAKKRSQDLQDGLKEAGCCATGAKEMMEQAGEFIRE